MRTSTHDSMHPTRLTCSRSRRSGLQADQHRPMPPLRRAHACSC